MKLTLVLLQSISLAEYITSIKDLYSGGLSNTNQSTRLRLFITPYSKSVMYNHKFLKFMQINDTKGMKHLYGRGCLQFYGREPPKITIKVESNTTNALETVYDGYPTCIRASSPNSTPLQKSIIKVPESQYWNWAIGSYSNDRRSTYTGAYNPRRQTMETIDELRDPSEEISTADIVRKILRACLNCTDGIL